jgi:hypothetical protein
LALRISNDLATGGARSITESVEGDGERRRVDQARMMIVLDADRRAIARHCEPGGIRNLAAPVGFEPSMSDQPFSILEGFEALLDSCLERRSIGTTGEVDLARGYSCHDQMNVGVYESGKYKPAPSVDGGTAVRLEVSGGFDPDDPAAVASKVDDPTAHATVPDRQRRSIRVGGVRKMSGIGRHGEYPTHRPA